MIIPENEYLSRLKTYEHAGARYRKICRALAWFRLLAFLGILLSLYFALTTTSSLFFFLMAAGFTVLLLIFVFYNVSYNQKRDYTNKLVLLCEAELKALRFEFLGFNDGVEFTDGSHAFSSDLDLFGHGSAFQYINRTVTFMGRRLLADWLAEPTTDPVEIVNRQESCRELSGQTDWRLHFAATRNETEVSETPENLLKWMQLPNMFANHSRWLRLISVWRVFMALLTVSVIAGWVNYNFLVLAGLVNLSFVGAYLRRINGISQLFGKTYPVLAKYTGLFNKLREAGFRSGWIKTRVDQMVSSDGSASKEINELRKLLQQFDSRNNLLVGFFRDALFLTDLLVVIRMEDWRNRNTGKIDKWLRVLGEVDALSSLATMAFNNPDYIYPTPVSGGFFLKAQDLGHPLIPAEERVCNDFGMKGWHTMLVLTGANMAGKSTFLRTVGLNHILAHAGGPVCAGSYEFLPSQLITSIRTNDSLIKHESYFYAELKKLKSIIDALELGQEVFILLDEVLKGTNSNDKLNGSIILIRKLLQLQTSGIIATHDIALGELKNEFPANISTSCFEAEISGNQLFFDYKLKPGTAQNMTAIFLMKQMNIV